MQSQQFIEFKFNWPANLKFVERKEFFLYLKYATFLTYIFVPWTLQPRVAALIPSYPLNQPPISHCCNSL